MLKKGRRTMGAGKGLAALSLWLPPELLRQSVSDVGTTLGTPQIWRGANCGSSGSGCWTKSLTRSGGDPRSEGVLSTRSRRATLIKGAVGVYGVKWLPCEGFELCGTRLSRESRPPSRSGAEGRTGMSHGIWHSSSNVWKNIGPMMEWGCSRTRRRIR